MGTIALALALAVPSQAWSQFPPATSFELSGTVYVDQADSGARTHLEQAKDYLEQQQWDEAVDTLRQVMDRDGDKLINLTKDRYVNVRHYGQLQLVQGPREALERYRARIDAQAEQWYREGIANRDVNRLLAVVDELFASSWTDDALYRLGEWALEAGNFAGARAYWQQIIPSQAGSGGSPTRLACPDTDINLADLRARLVLVSIWEGSRDRASRELDAFEKLHPGATGRLAGRDVEFGPVLRSQLELSAEWPAVESPKTLETFAGGEHRNEHPTGTVDVGTLVWQQELDPTVPDDASLRRSLGLRPRRVAEDNDLFLSYFPVVSQNVVFLAGPTGVRGFDLHTGKAAWVNPIFRDEQAQGGRASSQSALGVPRYTLTVEGRRLYARLGSPITSQANEFPPAFPAPGYLICLDLDAQGSLVWQKGAPEEGWAFEGTPLADEEQVYVALRRTDVRPQSHVAAYDAQTGRQRWTRKVAAAETPARGNSSEITYNLLTRDRDTLFINTNLGAIAALSTRDGRIRWLTCYPRAAQGDLNRPAAHFYRDLNPVLFHQGMLYVAPTDSEFILALDADSGQIVWQTPHAEDAVHLLGVGGGNLITSGDRLWWINAENGRLVARWPDGPSPRGYGRGMLVGDQVYWPTREDIYVFDQRTATQQKVIPLSARFPGATGGNLLLADGYLLVATATRAAGQHLLAFSKFSGLRERSDDEVADGSVLRIPTSARGPVEP